MKKTGNQKISIFIGVVSILVIILFSLIKKTISPYYKRKRDIVVLFDEVYDYNQLIFYSFIFLITSVLLFIFFDDNKILNFKSLAVKSFKDFLNNFNVKLNKFKDDKENTEYLKSMLIYSFIAFALLGIVIGLFSYNNYLTKMESIRPLKGFEAFYLSFFKTFMTILLISLGYKLYKIFKNN
jgi:hypothetical protein